MTKLNDFEIIRHGIEYSDYFTGCGYCFSNFDRIATGIGETEWEALQDAIETMAQCYTFDNDQLERIELECTEISENKYSTLDYLHDNLPVGIDPEDADSPWYYVSVRYNVS